jgi:hypothetical protein
MVSSVESVSSRIEPKAKIVALDSIAGNNKISSMTILALETLLSIRQY